MHSASLTQDLRIQKTEACYTESQDKTIPFAYKDSKKHDCENQKSYFASCYQQRLQRVALAKQAFFPFFVLMSSNLANFPEDPLKLIPKLPVLQPYATTIKLKRFKKIALFYPQYYTFCIPFIKIYRFIKYMEQQARVWIKKRNKI